MIQSLQVQNYITVAISVVQRFPLSVAQQKQAVSSCVSPSSVDCKIRLTAFHDSISILKYIPSSLSSYATPISRKHGRRSRGCSDWFIPSWWAETTPSAVPALSHFPLGAMVNLSTLTVPVLMETTSEASQIVHQWVRVYHYGHIHYPFLAITTCLLYGYMAYTKRTAQKPWQVFALAGATTLSMVPFTWIFMVPTNSALFHSHDLSNAGHQLQWEEIQDLLVTWNGLHFVRSLLPLTGAIFGVLGTCQVPIF